MICSVIPIGSADCSDLANSDAQQIDVDGNAGRIDVLSGRGSSTPPCSADTEMTLLPLGVRREMHGRSSWRSALRLENLADVAQNEG